MPLYEFVCASCGEFDRRLTFEAVMEPQICPTCPEPARRLFSPTYFRATPTASDLARSNDRDRIKRARSGEPRLERRPIDPAPAKPTWQPLHGAHGEKH